MHQVAVHIPLKLSSKPANYTSKRNKIVSKLIGNLSLTLDKDTLTSSRQPAYKYTHLIKRCSLCGLLTILSTTWSNSVASLRGIYMTILINARFEECVTYPLDYIYTYV